VAILEYAYNNVPFYRNKFDRAGIKPSDIQTPEDMKKIPITTKAELIEAGDDVFAEGYSAENCFSSISSGTTAEPFTSYFDRQAWHILKFAAKMRARQICGMKFGRGMINIDHPLGQEKRKKQGKRWDLKSLIVRKGFLSVNDPFKDHIEFYNRFKPYGLYSYPHYFAALIDYLEENELKMHMPELIFTSAEILDSITKRKIQNYFGEKVYDVYGASEVKEIAWECPTRAGYHTNDDIYLTEIVDGDSSGVGEIVLTSLLNRAMPLIRYAIGDQGKFLAKSCSCGRPFELMDVPKGRTADSLRAWSGKTISPYTLTTAIESISGIRQYQIIQKNNQDIVFNLKPSKDWQSADDSKITDALHRFLGPEMNIQIHIKEQIAVEASGKLLIVKSEKNKD